MVLESECFHGVGALEVHLLKVSALKLSHPSVCSVFQNFSRFSLLRHSLKGERGGIWCWSLALVWIFGFEI